MRIIEQMAAPTRERIVQHSAELFRRQGFAATGVKQIVAEASAPFGSIYHFFPGGKEQLGEEVMRYSGAIYGQLLDAFYKPGDAPGAAACAGGPRGRLRRALPECDRRAGALEQNGADAPGVRRRVQRLGRWRER